MKHVTVISRRPCRAQLPANVDLAAIFNLVANILTAISTAVLAKENQEFPNIDLPGSGGGSGS